MPLCSGHRYPGPAIATVLLAVLLAAAVQRARGQPGAGEAAEAAESARAHSYYSISTGTQIGEPSAVPFLTPVSKSVSYTICSVKKCLRHSR